MRVILRCSAFALVISAALVINHARAQNKGPVSPTIAAKKPVFAGACKACPWGILASVTADALKFYGYDVQVCWVCATSTGPRQVADRIKPVMPNIPSGAVPASWIGPPPDAAPDMGGTSEVNLIAAWNGTSDYAKDHKQRRNYRVIAVVRTITYMLAAATKKSGITDLRQIKDRKQPTWIVANADMDLSQSILFEYYGINLEELKAKGGGILPYTPDREKRASADVFIGQGLLADTPEQRLWYEVSQLNDLVFLDFEEPLIKKLAELPGWERSTVPLALFRGADRPIPTVMRPNHVIFTRDDAPDDFAYTVAKALDEHRELFQMQIMPWYYDPKTVGVSKVIPVHPGALKYYRERGYVK
jgi:uncharacterized protein